MNEGHIYIDEQITPDTYAMVKKTLASYHDRDKLVLHIASPGGSVYAGYNIYNALKLSGKPIKTIIEGEAQSMATFIALAGSEIEICNPSVFMIHMPHSGVEGTAENFEQGASELRTIENDMIAAYAAKTKLPPDQIREMMRKTTTLNATQAKQLGFADKVLGTYAQAVALGQTIKKPTTMTKTKEGIFAKIIQMAATALGEGPTAMDLKLKDGSVLNIDSADGEFVGKPATLNGAPAPDGTHDLEDGRKITVTGGMVTAITEAAKAAPVQPAPAPVAPIPAPAPVQTAEQKQLAEALAKLATMEAEKQAIIAEKQAVEAAKVAAETQAASTVQALGTIKKELEEKLKEEVGDQNPPAKGMTSHLTPQGRGPATGSEKERTMSFLKEHMGWILNYYPQSEVEKYASGPNAVSILETNFNYTYAGILTTDIFYKPSLGNPALTDLFTIDQGIKSHKQYNLVNPISKILKPYNGCDRQFNNNRAFITNTTVRTKEFQVNESWCKDDFTNYLSGGYNFLAQEWLKTGLKSFDPSGTPIATIIDNVLGNAMRIDTFRRASFAASNSSDDDYNQIDGLWDRLIDSSGASNYCVVRAGNALGTGTLAAGAALTALESVYANSNILLKDWDNIYAQFGGQVSKPTFWVTRSVWDNYYNSLIGTGAVTEAAFENLQKGLTFLTYKGYPVKPVSLWDQFLAESDNPLFATTRHLILFTTKDNHILGVENGTDLNKLEGWYERKDRKFYYEADLKMGYNYMHCDLQTIAY
jgi:ATP-dependent Clp endopeptidase proteolytic subunit ClpP